MSVLKRRELHELKPRTDAESVPLGLCLAEAVANEHAGTLNSKTVFDTS